MLGTRVRVGFFDVYMLGTRVGVGCIDVYILGTRVRVGSFDVAWGFSLFETSALSWVGRDVGDPTQVKNS